MGSNVSPRTENVFHPPLQPSWKQHANPPPPTQLQDRCRFPFPLKLSFFIIRYYLNQGAQGWCTEGRSAGNETVMGSTYCQWETWFVADLAEALALLDSDRVSVLFVKRAALDAVLVHFRVAAPSDYATEMTVDEVTTEILSQLRNRSSPLFAGNVTVSVDPTWGLSGEGGVEREYSHYLHHQV